MKKLKTNVLLKRESSTGSTMKYFKTDDDFWTAFGHFNSLYGDFGWSATTARKNHDDIFGVKILETETYFKLESGGGFHQVEKVAMSSMERIVYLLMSKNPRLERLGEEIEKKQYQAMVDALR